MHSEVKKYREESLQNRKGLTFYIIGHVVRVIGNSAFELGNYTGRKLLGSVVIS